MANEVVEYIRVDSPLLWERAPRDVVNVQNGLLELGTKQLKDHSPDHLSAVQLPVTYDPTASCPRIDRFISETFPEDATAVAYKRFQHGSCCPIHRSKRRSYSLAPAATESPVTSGWSKLFGQSQRLQSLSLHRLESDKFASHARLFGKLANVCPDLPTEHLAGTSVFKAITGGDSITGEYKFKDSFDFTPFVRLVFSANSPPLAHDASEGFFDRWLVVPFDRPFRGEGNEIPSATLDALLSEPSEQSGLLNRVIEVFARLQSEGRFSESQSVAEAFIEFHAAADPLLGLARSIHT